ncbi:MAG: hypothetical protein JWP78_1569 [Mucilaginibacter sp.]|nr:hypothetical protein [Mucilaginibacter sp.]
MGRYFNRQEVDQCQNKFCVEIGLDQCDPKGNKDDRRCITPVKYGSLLCHNFS